MSTDIRTPGNTPLVKARKLGEQLNIGKLYLKLESSNPTRTQKDRAAILHVEEAKRENFDTVVAASCGNYAASISYYASVIGLGAVVYIPEGSHSERLIEMGEKYGAKIVQVNGLYEDAVEASKRDAIKNKWFDANAGAHPDIGIRGYSKISEEIYQELGTIPEVVSVPVGNGTTLAGIYYGFVELMKSGVVTEVPRMIAASTDGGNPIIESFNNGRTKIVDLPQDRVKESELNEPLVNFRSYDGDIALKALLESKGFAEYVSDSELLQYSRLLMRVEGIETLPASAASIAALIHVLGRYKVTRESIAVLTG